ncbi:ATP-dependent DNA helicase [Opitutaceae bacterium TAV5]|nr:ATP-dependent DNA helicase [Opitutaceae bacterium TAV5]
MSEKSAADALRSDACLVVVEAPAGCGKTYQAATFAGACAAGLRPGRMLILTHTHAACDVIAKRLSGTQDAEIRTIDSLIVEIGTAYHRAIDLPADVSAWARQSDDGYDQVAQRVDQLVGRAPQIAAALVRRYPVVLCDEHQDSSAHQHGLVMKLRDAGARLRIFGDPMQSIYGKKDEFTAAQAQWKALCAEAQAAERLDVGRRWEKAAPQLGEWIQHAREMLRADRPIDLRGKLPAGLTVFRADNYASGYGNYRLDGKERVPIDKFLDPEGALLVLAPQNRTVGCLRGVFNRRLPIWEGHTRGALDVLVRTVTAHAGKPAEVAAAVLAFLDRVAVGFSASAFGNPFAEEVRTGASKPRRGKPAFIQELARMVLADPTHNGVATMLHRVEELAAEEAAFSGIKIDHQREYREAIQLGGFPDMAQGHAELTRRRSAMRPAPPRKAISTVHKAKGLECDRVLVLPCDKAHFADKPQHRCLLYVALSRPVRQLALVLPTHEVSPLFVI